MKNLIIAAIIAAAVATSCAPKQNLLTEEEANTGWQLLFDGKTLTGWRNYNTATLEGWRAKRGTLRPTVTDTTICIVTTGEYENFHLSLDWRQPRGTTSGVLYHVVERPEFATPGLTGPEYRLLAPPGEWNNSEIIFDNGHVQHRLNGTTILQYEAWTDEWFNQRDTTGSADAPEWGLAPRGVISLRHDGAPVWFRNIKIRELPRHPGRVDTLFNGTDLTGWVAYGGETFKVEDGAIVLESGPDAGYGYLATRRYYDNFDCTFEFRRQSGGNSGFFFRSVVFPPAIVNGWQVEIAPPGAWTGGIYESYGRGWLSERPSTDHLLTDGWNTMRVRAEGSRVTVWLNGTEVTALTDAAFIRRQGRLALQIHDGGGIRVQFRNFILKTL